MCMSRQRWAPYRGTVASGPQVVPPSRTLWGRPPCPRSGDDSPPCPALHARPPRPPRPNPWVLPSTLSGLPSQQLLPSVVRACVRCVSFTLCSTFFFVHGSFDVKCNMASLEPWLAVVGELRRLCSYIDIVIGWVSSRRGGRVGGEGGVGAVISACPTLHRNLCSGE
jgi:hypothetical protein